MKKLYILLFLMCPLSAQGSHLSQSPPVRALDRLFDSLGSDINFSTPGAYHDQAAGHYTGGGFYMRSKRESFQPIQVSLPHFGGRCGAMDAYFGSFSFMTKDQLLKAGRSILRESVVYPFKLGLSSMSSMIANEFSSHLKMLMDVNGAALDDCRMVEQMYAAALPKGNLFQEAACQDVRRQGSGEDWFGAKEKCRARFSKLLRAFRPFNWKTPRSNALKRRFNKPDLDFRS